MACVSCPDTAGSDQFLLRALYAEILNVMKENQGLARWEIAEKLGK